MTTMPWSSVFVTFFMAIFTKIFPCEWKAPVAQGLCRRVGVSVIPFLGDNLQRNKKLFSTWPAVLMALAAFLPRKRCHCFNSRIFFFFLISGLIGGWRYGITLLTCGSLPHTSQTAKLISREEMRLPWWCTSDKTGRALRFLCFVQPGTVSNSAFSASWLLQTGTQLPRLSWAC